MKLLKRGTRFMKSFWARKVVYLVKMDQEACLLHFSSFLTPSLLFLTSFPPVYSILGVETKGKKETSESWWSSPSPLTSLLPILFLFFPFYFPFYFLSNKRLRSQFFPKDYTRDTDYPWFLWRFRKNKRMSFSFLLLFFSLLILFQISILFFFFWHSFFWTFFLSLIYYHSLPWYLCWLV